MIIYNNYKLRHKELIKTGFRVIQKSIVDNMLKNSD